MNLDAHLDTILRRHDELGHKLGDGASGAEYADIAREYAELETLAGSIRTLRAKQKERADLEAMLADPALEADMREIAEAEVEETGAVIETMTRDIRLALLPKDAADESNVILEVRAGTGGDEAALFAGDLGHVCQIFRGARLEVRGAVSERGDGGRL
jgi:peptide chain release factor 1